MYEYFDCVDAWEERFSEYLDECCECTDDMKCKAIHDINDFVIETRQDMCDALSDY
jgi:hypothetical protein